MALKIQSQHYRHIAGQFKSLTNSEIRETVENAKSLDISDESKNNRIRHDLMARRVSSAWISDNLYPYMNDSHLDSALKKIAKEEGIPQCYSYESEPQPA